MMIGRTELATLQQGALVHQFQVERQSRSARYQGSLRDGGIATAMLHEHLFIGFKEATLTARAVNGAKGTAINQPRVRASNSPLISRRCLIVTGMVIPASKLGSFCCSCSIHTAKIAVFEPFCKRRARNALERFEQEEVER